MYCVGCRIDELRSGAGLEAERGRGSEPPASDDLGGGVAAGGGVGQEEGQEEEQRCERQHG